jgi:uncharacterized DUF497 family protein
MFIWDTKKAESNLMKHGVSFEEATSVFDDSDVLHHWKIKISKNISGNFYSEKRKL